MVARTPPMASLKKGLKNSILPRIHQPLPLNKRDSQQLLNSITSSFRKNLDKEHPWQSQDGAEPTMKAMSAALVKNWPSSESAQKYRPTDTHLDSILSNPLFAQKSATTTATATALQQHHAIFDSASSKGMMTVRRAAGYLASIHRELQVPTLDAPSAVAASGAGLRVVQWLRSSGAENSLEFLSHRMLMPLLVRFMFVEGLEEIAWTWLSRLGAQLHTLPKDGQTQQSLACLLHVIRLAQAYKDHAPASSQASLDASYSTFLRANQTLPAEDPAALKGLQRYWNSLSWSSTVHASHYQTPSAPLFEMFTDVGRPWKKPMAIAHLELHHPTNPDHSSAVTYLHNGHVERSAVKLKTSARYVERMVSLGADTVERLQVVGDEREASWVSEFMARSFFAWNFRPEGK